MNMFYSTSCALHCKSSNTLFKKLIKVQNIHY